MCEENLKNYQIQAEFHTRKEKEEAEKKNSGGNNMYTIHTYTYNINLFLPHRVNRFQGQKSHQN
jgi:hypothetical protein